MDDGRVKIIPTPAWFAEKGKDRTDLDAQTKQAYIDFREEYGPEKLANLSGDDLLEFFCIGYKDNSLCYALEFNKKYKPFGSIGGGSAYKFCVYYSKKDNHWKTSLAGNTPLDHGMRDIDADEAIELVTKLKEALLKGVDVIKSFKKIENINDYLGLAQKLREFNADIEKEEIYNFIYKQWVLKYYHMLFTDVIPNFYSEGWLNYLIEILNLTSHKDYLEKLGEITLYAKKTGLSEVVFSRIFIDEFGKPETRKWPQDLLNHEDEVDIHVDINTKTSKDYPRNRIIFGAPGTGKSYLLEQERKALIAKSGTFERVTFHPDYSYANFVGTYKPVQLDDEDRSIGYRFVPGPFMRIYLKALQNPEQKCLLIIEEINRANMAAVFGDIFQLLDRDKDGKSVFPIQTSEDVRQFLANNGLEGSYIDIAEMSLPSNLYIWATMNSADQGVYPMDTAFKRRWDFEYLGIDDKAAEVTSWQFKDVRSGAMFSWNEMRKAINDKLIELNVNEDKLLGPFFLKEADFASDKKFAAVFKSKVLMYLFEDAARQKRKSLFSGCGEKDWNIFSRICDKFDKRGVEIFCPEIASQFPVSEPAEQEEQ